MHKKAQSPAFPTTKKHQKKQVPKTAFRNRSACERTMHMNFAPSTKDDYRTTYLHSAHCREPNEMLTPPSQTMPLHDIQSASSPAEWQATLCLPARRACSSFFFTCRAREASSNDTCVCSITRFRVYNNRALKRSIASPRSFFLDYVGCSSFSPRDFLTEVGRCFP